MSTRYAARIGCLRHLENSAIGGEGKNKKLSMKADNKEIFEKKVLSYEAKSQEILGYEEKQLGLKRRNNDKEILSYEG